MASGQAKSAESRAEKSAGSSTESSAGSRGRQEWSHAGLGMGPREDVGVLSRVLDRVLGRWGDWNGSM